MFGDFVAQLGASTGTGQYSLGSTFGSTITWRSEFAKDDVVGYLATTQDATKREVGWGIFTIGTPDKLTRNVVRSTQANGPIVKRSIASSACRWASSCPRWSMAAWAPSFRTGPRPASVAWTTPMPASGQSCVTSVRATKARRGGTT